MTGTIAGLNPRGFGFITPEDGDGDLFFSCYHLHNGVTFDSDLHVGQQVTFERGVDAQRRLQAREVRPSFRRR